MIVTLTSPQAKGAATAGAAATGSLRDQLIQKGLNVQVTDASTIEDAYAQARGTGFDYVLKGAVTQWEDNATQWSGNPDKLALSIELYDVAARELIGTATPSAIGKRAGDDGGTPARLVDAVCRSATDSLFTSASTPGPISGAVSVAAQQTSASATASATSPTMPLPGSSRCVPGAQVQCACMGSKQGIQVCSVLGDRFDRCQCPADLKPRK